MIELYGWNDFFRKSFDELIERRKPGPDRRLVPARALSVLGGGVIEVVTPEGFSSARPSGSLISARREAVCPVTGDWLAVRAGQGCSSLTAVAVLPRRTSYARKAPGSGFADQVLFSNVDVLFLVCGLDRDYNPRRLERLLCLASGMRPVIVLNKSDLCSEPQDAVERARAQVPGVEVCAVSALERRGLDAFGEFLAAGVTAAFIGSSGCGKTSLVNELLAQGDPDRLPGAVAPVRPGDGRGRHTTTRRELLRHATGALLMDNPGLREVQLWMDDERPGQGFPDIAGLAGGCRFRDCLHSGEPGCAVQAALLDGSLDQDRFLSYLKLQDEVGEVARRRRGSGRGRREGGRHA